MSKPLLVLLHCHTSPLRLQLTHNNLHTIYYMYIFGIIYIMESSAVVCTGINIPLYIHVDKVTRFDWNPCASSDTHLIPLFFSSSFWNIGWCLNSKKETSRRDIHFYVSLFVWYFANAVIPCVLREPHAGTEGTDESLELWNSTQNHPHNYNGPVCLFGNERGTPHIVWSETIRN